MKATYLALALALLVVVGSQATMPADAMPRRTPWMNLTVERVTPAHTLEELNDALIPLVVQQVSNFYARNAPDASQIELARFLSGHFDQVQVGSQGVGQGQFIYHWVFDPPTGETIRVCTPVSAITIGEGNSSNPIVIRTTVEVFGG